MTRQPNQATPEQAQKLLEAGNYQEALEMFKQLLNNPETAEEDAAQSVLQAGVCLANLGRVSELDALWEEAVTRHAKRPRVLEVVARQYSQTTHYGQLIANAFVRGGNDGRGRVVYTHDHDRVRAMQLLWQALDFPAAQAEERKGWRADAWIFLAELLQDQGQGRPAWKLQLLTDLTTLPEKSEAWNYGGGQAGAPVTPDGEPVYYRGPASWSEAKSDGERWRFALDQAEKVAPERRGQLLHLRASFLKSQFGEQNLAGYRAWFAPPEDGTESKSGILSLHTLKPEETVTRLATGVKRFTLPDDQNFIRIWEEQSSDKIDVTWRRIALQELARTYENRRQFDTAVGYWKRSLSLHDEDYVRNAISQIEGNLGRFEPVPSQAKGQGGVFDFVYRNAQGVKFTARKIDVPQLLTDMKQHVRTWKGELDYRIQMLTGQLGMRLIEEDQAKYIAQEVTAEWKLKLEPLAGHWDRRTTVTSPLSDPGAYWVTAEVENGNTTHCVLWIQDLMLIRKAMSGGHYYYVGDAQTGAPVAKANIEFFGYGFDYQDNNRPKLELRNFAEFSAADGSLFIDDSRLQLKNHSLTWLVSARGPEGQFAFMDLEGLWISQASDYRPRDIRSYFVSDRPVYRPGDAVQMKVWFGDTDYGRDGAPQLANQSVELEITDPRGNRQLLSTHTTDAFGGVAWDYTLPKGATLGVYSVRLGNYGQGSFRVEEYKKPEFEVTVEAPKEPALLGDKVQAKVIAKYYFGGAVSQATLKYKIERTTRNQTWYPVGPWDWLYGRGYLWLAEDAAWHPSWQIWGCIRPYPIWWPTPSAPPELVAEREVPLNADGTFDIEIDTALAKELYPNSDHAYSITAEVVDASRRTIVGSGEVLAARQPFQVTAWLNQGFYRAGDSAKLNFRAYTANQSGVPGKVQVKLFKLRSNEEGEVQEDLLETWNTTADAKGEGEQGLRFTEPGQYRLLASVTDSKGFTAEGGSLITVRGQGLNDAQLQFNDLELVTQAAEYRVGETAKLLINTNRLGATVLFFPRAEAGLVERPQLYSVNGKSVETELKIADADQPNIFVEAVTISNGRVYTETKQILVPPVKRVVNVEVLSGSKEYRPGEEASVQIRLTSPDGKPVTGSTVVAVYDKSVEYIAGGSGSGDIREFFWNWKRNHYPQTASSVIGYNSPVDKKGQPGMGPLGLFGDTLADDARLVKRKGGLAKDSGPGGFRQLSAGRTELFARAGRMEMEYSMNAPAAPMAAMADGLAVSEAAGGADFAFSQGKAEVKNAVQPTVRKEFADTAFWAGSLTPDANGIVNIKFKVPDNLTTWKTRVWSMGSGTRVGQGDAELISTKKLLVRPQVPRFFVQTDEVTLSAIVHNYLSTAKATQVKLEVDERLQVLGDPSVQVEVPANGERRVDWTVKVLQEGETTVRMLALTDEESDAAQQVFPAYVHGMLKTDSVSGMIALKETEGEFEVVIPSARRPEQSKLEVQFSPTLVGSLVDALPYLVNYPYGCTEQTLNRFLPTVIVHRILKQMNVNLGDIQEYHTNLNSQQLGAATERGKQWKVYEINPVFDEAEVERMTKQGLQRLSEMQLSDGGWGWFSGWGEHASPHLTALVIHGLKQARESEVAVPEDVYNRGLAWLTNYRTEQVALLRRADLPEKERLKLPYKTAADNLDALVHMVLQDNGQPDAAMRDFLYRDRLKLSVYAQAMVGLALHAEGDQQRRDMVVRNLKQYEVNDKENQTVYLKLPSDGGWWYWYGSEYEAHAYYLKLLNKVAPQGDTAPRLAKYLLNNRRHGGYWKSTRDTAICIEALAEFWKASGEDRPNLEIDVLVDGKLVKTVQMNADNLFRMDNRLVLEGEALTSGAHKIAFKKRGTGPLYFNAYSTNFTLEDPIPAAGLEVKVERKLYYLKPRKDAQADVATATGSPTKIKVEKYDRVPLQDSGELTSGDLLEVELVIESKNDYEYLLFEDLKASGCEAVELRSGYGGNELGAYMELRDERTSFFLTTLNRGRHSLSYRLRAEIPGKFSVLPAKVQAMYAPELVGNSREQKLRIADRPLPGGESAGK